MATGRPAEGPGKADFSWRSFLTDAGIQDPFRNQYAAMLNEAHMDETMIPTLTPDILGKIGIKSVGHQIRILKRIKVKSEVKTMNRPPKPSPYLSKFGGVRQMRRFPRPQQGSSITNHLLTRSLLAVLPSWSAADSELMARRRSGSTAGALNKKAPSEILSLPNSSSSNQTSSRSTSTFNTPSFQSFDFSSFSKGLNPM